jgi:hypothetical protein
LKSFIAFISGLIVCALSVYLTLDWQEEKLTFSISSPAKFGEINFQNLTLQNTGWNPAVNLKVFVEHPSINFKNIQSDSTLKELAGDKSGLTYIDRIRRDETIIISFAYEGSPLTVSSVKVTSERSIAEAIDINDKNSLLLNFNKLIAILTSILSGALMAILYFNQQLKKQKEELIK